MMMMMIQGKRKKMCSIPVSAQRTRTRVYYAFQLTKRCYFFLYIYILFSHALNILNVCFTEVKWRRISLSCSQTRPKPEQLEEALGSHQSTYYNVPRNTKYNKEKKSNPKEKQYSWSRFTTISVSIKKYTLNKRKRVRKTINSWFAKSCAV
jgi:hypothetical protein